jgi:hypothetical protein
MCSTQNFPRKFFGKQTSAKIFHIAGRFLFQISEPLAPALTLHERMDILRQPESPTGMPELDAIEIMMQVLSALNHAHKNGENEESESRS